MLIAAMLLADSSDTTKLSEGVTSRQERKYSSGKISLVFQCYI